MIHPGVDFIFILLFYSISRRVWGLPFDGGSWVIPLEEPQQPFYYCPRHLYSSVQLVFLDYDYKEHKAASILKPIESIRYITLLDSIFKVLIPKLFPTLKQIEGPIY